MPRFLTAILAGTALLTAAHSANALTMSGGFQALTNTLTDYNTGLAGTLNRFNTTLGTLNSISITYSYGFNSTITVVASTASSGDTQTKSGAAFGSTDAGVQAVLDALVNTTFTAIGASIINPSAYTLLGTDRIFNQAAGTTQTYNSSTSSNVSTTVSSSSNSQLTPFEDSTGSAFNISAQTLTGTTGSTTGGNATISQQTFANQYFAISYDYSAPVSDVPEPASMALLGAGLISAGLLRRRAK